MTSPPNIYFEIGPLKESEYTGIAQVTAALAEQLLNDREVEVNFFFGRMMVPHAAVEDLLARRSGELLEWYLRRTEPSPAPRALSRNEIAVFPNRKTCRRGFQYECQIIHDLSTLLTPQFHHQDTINYHATSMEEDIMSNDITFSVSEATRTDILSYFPAVDKRKVSTILNAAHVHTHVGNEINHAITERYIIVLGTIEPRKNISQILQYLKDRPDFSKRYKIVFLGRFGWGTSVGQLIEEFHLTSQFRANRIIFPGFVTEEVKIRLIRHARLLIYPSLFEGFGLPILEAACLGVPTVTTRSSSLPEAGGPHSYYFDPFLPGDFERTLMKAVLDQEVSPIEIRTKLIEWASTFSWTRSYKLMKTELVALATDVESRNAW